MGLPADLAALFSTCAVKQANSFQAKDICRLLYALRSANLPVSAELRKAMCKRSLAIYSEFDPTQLCQLFAVLGQPRGNGENMKEGTNNNNNDKNNNDNNNNNFKSDKKKAINTNRSSRRQDRSAQTRITNTGESIFIEMLCARTLSTIKDFDADRLQHLVSVAFGELQGPTLRTHINSKGQSSSHPREEGSDSSMTSVDVFLVPGRVLLLSAIAERVVELSTSLTIQQVPSSDDDRISRIRPFTCIFMLCRF
jgi:hypothetical protein